MKFARVLSLAVAIAFLATRPAFAQYEPGFHTPAQYAIGASNALEPGDFDGDGDLDMASANTGFPDKKVAVVLNDGTGRFGPAIETVISPHYPLDLAGADFNEDGKTDLAMATLSATLVLLAGGDGTFTVITLRGQADTVACADFDRDGNADLAVTVREFPNNIVRVFAGNGDGTFDPPVDYSTQVGSKPEHLFAVDTESDGDTDLVYSDGSSVYTRLNNGGTFGVQVFDVGSGDVGMAVDYLNGDGNADLVTVDASGGNVTVHLGDGVGGFTQAASYNVIVSQGIYVTTGDFNGDGKVDIAAGDDNDVVVLLRGLGTGQFELVARYMNGGYDLVAVDVSGDGRDDLFGHSLRPNELSVAMGTFAGLHLPRVHTFAGFNGLIELGDVNGDGRVDTVGTGGNFAVGLDVLLNLGAGLMGPPLVSATALTPRALVLGDLNEDGKLDAVVGAVPVGGAPNLEILIGNGSGEFTHLSQMNNGSNNAIYAEALDLGDMNGDGHLDLVSNTFAAISVLPGNGDGTFGPPIISGVGAGTGETVRVRDFDGDGILDVVTATWTGTNNNAESTIHLNLGNGDGTLDWAQSFVIDANRPHGDAADLNGDGLPDLSITGTPGTHTGQGGMFVAMNLGGLFAPPVHYPAAHVSLALGDLNGDARPEAVLTNASAAGVVEVWTNTGDGTFAPSPLKLPTLDSPYEVEIANLLGSPRLDLAVLGSAINPSQLVLYRNQTGPFASAKELSR